MVRLRVPGAFVCACARRVGSGGRRRGDLTRLFEPHFALSPYLSLWPRGAAPRPARYTKDRQKLFQRIRYAPLRLPSTLTPEACDVLTRLLDRDPLARLGARRGPDGAAEVQEHPFFREVRATRAARAEPPQRVPLDATRPPLPAAPPSSPPARRRRRR